MKTNRTQLGLLLFSLTFPMLVMGFLLCSVPLWAGPSDDASASQIRTPWPGENIEAFWNAFKWADLTLAEQAQWQKLGWDAASWEGEAAEPASEKNRWRELTAEERSAAAMLGYDQKSWDATLGQ